jgi:orotate phosphoribosyltransferase
MTLPQAQVAQALLAINAVGFSPQQPVTFKSGIISPVYVDNRRLPYHPAQWRVIIEGFQAYIAQNQLAFDVIGGIAVGGVPHSAALGYMLQMPSIFIRAEAKEHGAKKRVEGGDVVDKRVLLVEDMVTTGGSSLNGVNALRDEKALVSDMLAIISYGFQEADKAFSAANITLHTLTNFTVLLDEALKQDKFSTSEAEIIHDWFVDPHGWAGRHGFA